MVNQTRDEEVRFADFSIQEETVTAIDKLYQNLQRNFSPKQNYPNPFNPTTKITCTLPFSVNSETSNLKLIMFNILVGEVTTLVNKITNLIIMKFHLMQLS